MMMTTMVLDDDDDDDADWSCGNDGSEDAVFCFCRMCQIAVVEYMCLFHDYCCCQVAGTTGSFRL